MTADKRTPQSDDPFDQYDPFDECNPLDTPRQRSNTSSRPTSTHGQLVRAAEQPLEQAVAQAFERMGPSDEAADRMLCALVAASKNESHHQNEVLAPPTAHGRGALRKKPFRTVKIALPIAACLVLLAGVGIFALGQGGGAHFSMSAQSEMNALGSAYTGNSPDESTGNAASDPAQGASPSSSEGAANSSAPSSNETRSSSTSGEQGQQRQHPLHIVLTSGTRLTVATAETGIPLEASTALVREELSPAYALLKKDSSAESGEACTVFAYANDAYPYAVRYIGDDRFYLALEAPGT